MQAIADGLTGGSEKVSFFGADKEIGRGALRCLGLSDRDRLNVERI